MAERIKLLVEENGWSQKRAAEYFNKSQTWVSDQLIIVLHLPVHW